MLMLPVTNDHVHHDVEDQGRHDVPLTKPSTGTKCSTKIPRLPRLPRHHCIPFPDQSNGSAKVYSNSVLLQNFALVGFWWCCVWWLFCCNAMRVALRTVRFYVFLLFLFFFPWTWINLRGHSELNENSSCNNFLHITNLYSHNGSLAMPTFIFNITTSLKQSGIQVHIMHSLH